MFSFQFLYANSVDADKMLHSVACVLGLHCLPSSNGLMLCTHIRFEKMGTLSQTLCANLDQ